MGIGEILKVLASPMWSDKNIDAAAQGFANGSCNDDPSMQHKAFLEIARKNYNSGHTGLFAYILAVVNEINLMKKN